MGLESYIAYWARVRGSETALISGSDELSWNEIHDRATGLAATLQANGVVEGDRVGCLLDNGIDWCITYYGALTAGAIFVPINVRFGRNEIEDIVRDAGCEAIVSSTEFINHAGAGWNDAVIADDRPHVLFADREKSPVALEDAVAFNGPVRPPTRRDDRLAFLGYTSGTTGVPKGVMLRHSAIELSVMGVVLSLGWTSADRFLIMSPLPFTGGYLNGLTPAMIVGGCAVIESKPDIERALKLVADKRITVMPAVATVWDRMSQLDAFEAADLSCLRTGLVGGMPVAVSLLERYLEKGVRIFQGYACTESGGFATMSFWPLAFEKPHLCGPTTQNIDLIIADDDLVEVESGTVGEILVRGPQIFSGYWRKPKETEDSYFDGWFRTGDMGRVDEHGNLEIVDRKKNMIISGGVNIYPAEIERAMSGVLPGSELAVFGVEDQRWGERVVAMIVSDDEVNLTDLKTKCKALLGDYKCPREFILSAEALPRTATGKVSRKELLDYYDRYQPRTAAEA